ncbi:phage/plasmid primase, P4 family [Parasphingorhabdus sp.]|uniref:phage/plasmid primase, P4 family n=1 Tax=Parasphingorhabdus sp. TaxID=2709688 RepID=UPI0030015AAB
MGEVKIIPQVQPGWLSPDGKPTEESLAREWVTLHGREWRFDHTARKWLHWDGQRWSKDDCRLIGYLLAEHLRAAGAATKSTSIASTKTARGVEIFASTNPAIARTHDAWDVDPWLLGTPSGTVDLRTGKIFPADPGQQITKLAAVAPGDGTPTLWLRFLSEAAAGDQAVIGFLRRWCGYCLTGSTREHAFAFIHGPGGNGKSVFLNAVSGILGEYAATAAMETFADSRNDRHSTELAMLKGARLVTASETEQGRGWAESKVKAITGGDPITARFMRQDNFTFTPHFKLMIAGNHAPSLRNVDDAMRRRLNILPFVGKPAYPDRELENKLRAEWPQMLAWMIEGCVEWQHKGLQRPDAVAGATDRYFSDQDVFGQWMDDQCERADGVFEQPTPLFKSWSDYAVDAGEHPGNAKDFKANLERRGIHRAKTVGLKVYRGISLQKASHD